jgi:hypothetical protein
MIREESCWVTREWDTFIRERESYVFPIHGPLSSGIFYFDWRLTSSDDSLYMLLAWTPLVDDRSCSYDRQSQCAKVNSCRSTPRFCGDDLHFPYGRVDTDGSPSGVLGSGIWPFAFEFNVNPIKETNTSTNPDHEDKKDVYDTSFDYKITLLFHFHSISKHWTWSIIRTNYN